MKENLVVTISREYGSGGRYIAHQVAEALNIPFYDRELIDMAAQKSGLAADYIRENEEKVPSRILFHSPISRMSGSLNHSFLPDGHYSNLDRMFFAQSAIIREIAESESCVIVGRCADYVLREHENCLRVFVYADIDSRLARAVEHLGVDPKNAASEVMKRDKHRANYYYHYTDQKWGEVENYHLSVDSGFFGAEGAAKLIVEAVEHIV